MNDGSKLASSPPVRHRKHEHRFSVYTVNQCACGCTVRQGSMIIGRWFVFEGAFLSLIAICGFIIIDFKELEIGKEKIIAAMIDLSVFMVFAILDLVFGITLIVGVSESVLKLLKAWIFYALFSIAFLIIYQILRTFYFIIEFEVSQAVLSWTRSLMSIVLTIYYVLVVNSHYWNVKREQAETIQPE